MSILSWIFLSILISIVALSEIRKRNKEIEKLKSSWKFCKSLLDDTRALLTEEQKEKLKKVVKTETGSKS